MPLAPLPNPENIKLRLRGLLVAMPAVAFLGSSLMAANAVQMASLPVLPISRSAFRKTNRWVANTWWGWCVTAGEVIHDISLVVSGDDVPMRENAIVIVNHQDMADITFVMAFAKSKDRLGDLKWFVKKAIKIVPGVGWGMVFLDCIFVDRQWTSDRASVQAAFRRFSRDSIPIWLVSFVEGTRLTPEKLVQSQRYARQLGINPSITCCSQEPKDSSLPCRDSVIMSMRFMISPWATNMVSLAYGSISKVFLREPICMFDASPWRIFPMIRRHWRPGFMRGSVKKMSCCPATTKADRFRKPGLESSLQHPVAVIPPPATYRITSD